MGVISASGALAEDVIELEGFGVNSTGLGELAHPAMPKTMMMANDMVFIWIGLSESRLQRRIKLLARSTMSKNFRYDAVPLCSDFG